MYLALSSGEGSGSCVAPPRELPCLFHNGARHCSLIRRGANCRELLPRFCPNQIATLQYLGSWGRSDALEKPFSIRKKKQNYQQS